MSNLSVSAGYFVLPHALPIPTAAHFLTLIETYLSGEDYLTYLHPGTDIDRRGDWEEMNAVFSQQLVHSPMVFFDGVGKNLFTRNIVATLNWLQEGIETRLPEHRLRARQYLRETAAGLAQAGPVLYRYIDVVEGQTYCSLELWQVTQSAVRSTAAVDEWNWRHYAEFQWLTLIEDTAYLSQAMQWDEIVRSS